MALISIASGDHTITSVESVQKIEFDGFMRVSDNSSSTVTSRPAEEGYDYTDAVHIKARTLDVSIIISDTNQSIFDTRSYATILSNLTGADTYVQQQLEILENFHENRFKIILETKYKDYEDYLIQNISYDETNDQGLTINFSLIEVREGTVTTTDNVTAGEYS